MRKLLDKRVTKDGVRSFITMNGKPDDNKEILVQVIMPIGLDSPFLDVDLGEEMDRLVDKGIRVSLFYVDDRGFDYDIEIIKRDYPYFEEVVL